MYRLYRLFASYGYGTDFIRLFEILPQNMIKHFRLVPVHTKSR